MARLRAQDIRDIELSSDVGLRADVGELFDFWSDAEQLHFDVTDSPDEVNVTVSQRGVKLATFTVNGAGVVVTISKDYGVLVNDCSEGEQNLQAADKVHASPQYDLVDVERLHKAVKTLQAVGEMALQPGQELAPDDGQQLCQTLFRGVDELLRELQECQDACQTLHSLREQLLRRRDAYSLLTQELW